MKKYTMIFVSVILALTTLLIPIDNVDAATNTYDINSAYDFESLDGPTTTKLLETIDFLKSIEDDYYVLLTYQRGTYYYKIFIADKTNTTINQSTFYYSSKTYQIVMKLKGTTNAILSEFRNYSFDSEIQNFKDKFNNGTFTTYTDASIVTSTQSGPAYLLYSNIDFKINNIGSSNAIVYNGENLKVGDIIPSWYDVYDIPTINISSGYICDLEGRDAEYVTIDFNEFANENYTYQYGIKRQANIDFIKWYPLENINNYIYNFNEYYDGTIIYARVLDSQGNEISRNQYIINNAELPKFGLNINSGLACPIPNYEGDPQAEIINVDFRNAYFENYKYYYSYDSKTKYQINVTSEQLTHQIVEYLYNFIYFYIYDENDNLIYYTYNDVSSSNRLGTLPDDYEIRHNIEFSDGVACDLDGNKIINVKFDFSNITKFINHYNFDVVINGQHFGAIQYHEITLNEQNYTQNYEVKIYIDTFLYLNRTYSVGGVLGGQDFEDTYDNMLNNGNWKDDLEVKDVEDMGDLVIQFLGAISTFISTFFDLLDFFFQRLNFWIRACIITLFIELVICKIIKGVRK